MAFLPWFFCALQTSTQTVEYGFPEHITTPSESFPCLYEHSLNADHCFVWLSVLLRRYIYKLFWQCTFSLKYSLKIESSQISPHFHVPLWRILQNNPYSQLLFWQIVFNKQTIMSENYYIYHKDTLITHIIFIPGCEKRNQDRHSDFCFLMLPGLEIEESFSGHLYPTFTNEILFSAICFLLMYSMSHKLYNQKKHCVIQSVLLIEPALWLL